MIYGINFNSKYEYYINKRSISKKIKCSINEWNIAQSLLKIPQINLNEDNKEYYDLIKARIMEEEFEMSLDKRL